MTFADIPAGTAVFLDANTFVYYFGADPVFGPPCKQLLDRIEQKDLEGYASAHVLAEVAHRLMTLEAMSKFGWPMQGMAQRLKRHPAEVQQLSKHRSALDEITLIGVRSMDVSSALVSRAADISIQTGLLTADAVIVAVMQQHGLSHLASHDGDFDRMPGITRYEPA